MCLLCKYSFKSTSPGLSFNRLLPLRPSRNPAQRVVLPISPDSDVTNSLWRPTSARLDLGALALSAHSSDSHNSSRCAQWLQLHLTLCDPMDCSPSASSVHGIILTRILEWVATSSSRWQVHYSQLADEETEVPRNDVICLRGRARIWNLIS